MSVWCLSRQLPDNQQTGLLDSIRHEMIHSSVPWDRRWRMEFVELQGGLTLPVEILEFALRLEDRGVHLQVAGDVLKVTADAGKPVLSEDEVAFIRKRKAHLMAVAAYQAPKPETSVP